MADTKPLPVVGEVYRDKDADGRNYMNHGGKNQRRVEITAVIEGVGVYAQVLTWTDGKPRAKPLKTRISFKTLASRYERIAEAKP